MQLLLLDMFKRVTTVNLHISTCDIIGAEPLVQNVTLFKNIMEVGSNRVISAAGLDHELALARALSFPDFAWISGLDIDELQEFRHKDGNTVFRNTLWKSRKKLKRATLEDFDSVIQAINEELVDAIDKYNEEVAKIKKISKLDKSLAAPPIASVTIPLALTSLLIGSPSVRNLINLHIQQKKNIEELHQRPIGILARHYNKAINN